MAKFLINATYTAEGLQGLAKDTAAGRKTAVQAALKAVGGKLECFYFAFGADDAILIVEVPDNASAAAIALQASATGLVRIRTTPLLTPAEVDQALTLPSKYKAPGQGK